MNIQGNLVSNNYSPEKPNMRTRKEEPFSKKGTRKHLKHTKPPSFFWVFQVRPVQCGLQSPVINAEKKGTFFSRVISCKPSYPFIRHFIRVITLLTTGRSPPWENHLNQPSWPWFSCVEFFQGVGLPPKSNMSNGKFRLWRCIYLLFEKARWFSSLPCYISNPNKAPS